MDPYSLSLGYELSDAGWEVRKREYLGRPRYPEQPLVDRGRKRMPLQLRVRAWRSERWMHFLRALNETCAEIMAAALADKDIMPVHRYRQVRRAFSVFVSERAGLAVVEKYKSMLLDRQRVWLACVMEVQEGCVTGFFKEAVVARPNEYFGGRRFLACLKDVHIGRVKMDGRVDHEAREWDATWDMKDRFVWRAL